MNATPAELAAIRAVLALPARARVDITRDGWKGLDCYFTGQPAALVVRGYADDRMEEWPVSVEMLEGALVLVDEIDPHTVEVDVCYWWARFNANPDHVLTRPAAA